MSPTHIGQKPPAPPKAASVPEVTIEELRRNLRYSMNKAFKVAGKALSTEGRERFAAYKFLASMGQAAVMAGQQEDARQASLDMSAEEATELLALGLRTTPMGRNALREAYEAMGDVAAATCADDAAAVLSSGDDE